MRNSKNEQTTKKWPRIKKKPAIGDNLSGEGSWPSSFGLPEENNKGICN